ncbi:ThiF family adenylyltransferase [Paenibacillus odorifer]|uniref:ThiF family adenylyltransferase n=1 Tax=Paenibacillus TaxID=44249 RepID=UPI00096C4D1D|nr:ThiF family adenylyltransferase [Paenibacillus odorifer]OMC92081.1 hypothetical protein BJP46_09775 [Paenibacillus odorifer]OME26406.1 hypothetical protein BSK57_08955 [Paenibacillus odorifer]
MEDQHNLELYYDGVLENVALHLTGEYKAVEVDYLDLRKNGIVKSFRITRQVDQNILEIIVSIPYNFPDVFPVVTIPDPLFSEIYPIPHLDLHKVLCVFDAEIAHPNSENPNGVLDEVINKAFVLIKEGKSGQNSSDYIDEFESYWGQDAKSQLLSLISITSEPKEIDIITFKQKNWNENRIVTDSRREGEYWLIKAGAKIEAYNKAFYLPLRTIGNPPFPTLNSDFLKLLIIKNPEIVKPFLDFLDNNKRPTTIVFSVPYKNDFLVGAWEHKLTEKKVITPFKGKVRVQKSLNGFRIGKQNAFLELQRDFRKLVVNKINVMRVDKERLFTRGGDGELPDDVRIGVIGCGSVGSHVIGSLVDSGIDQFLLIDEDTLKFENIARHTCGASQVGKPKVEAIKQKLVDHFPYIEISGYKENVLKILKDYSEILNSCFFSIVALGNFSTEWRLNQLQNNGLINKPLMYVWVEPYLAGAHAVYVDPSLNGCFACLFDRQHKFRQSVLADPSLYSKREAGCQSTYVPYSVTEVKRFISDLSFFMDDVRSGKLKENTLFTWLGNLSYQKQNGRRIAGRWAIAENYSVRKVPLSEFGICEHRKK